MGLMKSCRDYPHVPAVPDGVPGVMQIVNEFIAEIKKMQQTADHQIASSSSSSSSPTKIHLLLLKLESHMLEWKLNWEKVVEDSKSACIKEGLVYDVRAMIRFDILATYFKSAVWANHCPHGRRRNECKDCGGT